MDDKDKDARPGVEGTGGRTDVPGFSLKRLLPLVVLLGGLVGFFAFGLDQYVTFDALRQHREEPRCCSWPSMSWRWPCPCPAARCSA
jgi:hypothetical protein